MKPFNLEAALRGEKVVTRDGREVTQLAHFKCALDYPLRGILSDCITAWSEYGLFQENEKNSADLFMAKKMKKVQCRLYKSSYGGIDVAIGDKEYLNTPRARWVSDILEVEIEDND